MLAARIQLPQDYDLQQLLTETFAQFPIHRLKYYIWRWYRAAMEYEPYHYCQCPARVIDLHRLLETLILVAEQLENDLPPAVKEAHPAMQLDDYNLDVLFNKGLSKIFETYEGVIRYLFEAEAANPQLFFVRFFRFRPAEEWVELLDDWQEFAFDNFGLAEWYDANEMPEALELLLGLCEACWLLLQQFPPSDAEKKVYDAGSIKLPYRAHLQPPNPAQMEHTHRNHYTKAVAFLAGARSFLAQDEYALSAFMLHQSMESALKALLAPAMKHCFKTHSLHKLLGMVRYVSPETGKPFPRDTEEEIILFQLLQKAYIHARYKNNFTIDRAQCEALITRVASVLDMLPEEFEQMVKAIHGAENPPGFDC